MMRVLYTVTLAIAFVAALFLMLPVSPTSKAQTSTGDSVVYAGAVETRAGKRMTISKAAIAELKAKSSKIELSVSAATGAADFIRVKNDSSFDLAAEAGSFKPSRTDAANSQIGAGGKSKLFFRENAALFGVSDPDSNLLMQKEEPDEIGGTHQTFQQYFNGVEVFAGQIKTHLDKNDNLYAVGGSVVPEIEVDVTPRRTAETAADTAIAKVSDDLEAGALTAESTKLFVFRTNLVKGIPGEDRLVWEVTVTNNSNVREFVYIDAHTGKFVDQYTGIPDALVRRAFDGNGSTSATPPNYPAVPYWIEGQALPTASTEANNMITSSGETYNFYQKAFGRDSFNGTGGIMDAIFNRGNACPNASWNGTFISFCPGLTTDDVTSHEWSHAYTQYTHNLIYAWQPGALNEGYSDIFGETVDRINNRDNIGNSLTDSLRTAGTCSTYTPTSPKFVVNSPASIAGEYGVGRAAFGPALTNPGVTADVVLATDANDAAGPSTTDACSALTNAAAVAGKIAFIDRGTCGFKLKVLNAQNAGAVGVIIANISTSANSLLTMADDAAITTPITIPAVQTLFATGNTIRAQFGVGVNATIGSKFSNSDASTRWLLGEDSTATGLTGALRDMYNPICLGNPGKVSDTAFYSCGPNTQAGDNGGVHTNSGVINHAYALLVDGGTYNGQTVGSIGLTKAAHIYWRAESVYQNSVSDFSFHADSLEQSATDLIGVNLNDLSTGAPSGQSITAADVAQVTKAILAVELRIQPTACNFLPLLAKSPPAEPTCATGSRDLIFTDNFDGANSGWTVGRSNTLPGNTLIDWKISSILPANVGTPASLSGNAYFVENPYNSCDATAQDETALRFLTSPLITIPASYASSLTLNFDHAIASEANYDGGQLLYSVNGGAFTLVPNANFTYNAPNATLAAAPGNSNPQAGQRAWSGADGGGVSRGTVGRTVVNMTGLAVAGNTVRFRWSFGNDSCAGSTTGWYVDNVKLNACLLAPTAASSSLSGRVMAGGGRGIAGAILTVSNVNGGTRMVRTNSMGRFQINDLESGATYVVNVRHKSYNFAPVVLTLTEDLSEFVITANR